MAYRTTTILLPTYGRNVSGRILQSHERPPLTVADYVIVPTIETYGVWSVQDLISKKKAKDLATYANRLESEGWR